VIGGTCGFVGLLGFRLGVEVSERSNISYSNAILLKISKVLLVFITSLGSSIKFLSKPYAILIFKCKYNFF